MAWFSRLFSSEPPSEYRLRSSSRVDEDFSSQVRRECEARNIDPDSIPETLRHLSAPGEPFRLSHREDPRVIVPAAVSKEWIDRADEMVEVFNAFGAVCWRWSTEANTHFREDERETVYYQLRILAYDLPQHIASAQLQLAAEEEAEEAARANAVLEFRRTVETIVRNAKDAAQEYEALPVMFARAAEAHRDAEQAFADGAFSPFWTCIEEAYASLALLRQSIDQVGQKGHFHQELVQRAIQLGGDPGDIADFPIEALPAVFKQDAETAATQLASTVYEAQKHPVFAQIWEQRRTTAAVIAGFTGLEQAILRMRESLAWSIEALTTELTSSRRQLLDEMRTQSYARSREADEMRAIASEQAKTMGAIADETASIREGLGLSPSIW